MKQNSEQKILKIVKFLKCLGLKVVQFPGIFCLKLDRSAESYGQWVGFAWTNGEILKLNAYHKTFKRVQTFFEIALSTWTNQKTVFYRQFVNIVYSYLYVICKTELI